MTYSQNVRVFLEHIGMDCLFRNIDCSKCYMYFKGECKKDEIIKAWLKIVGANERDFL